MKLWSIMAAVGLIALAPLTVQAQQVDAKLQEKFVGQWVFSTGEVKDAVFEFAKNGDLKLTMKLPDTKLELSGKFKVVSEDSIEMTIKTPDGKDSSEKLKFKFDKEGLTLTGPEGKTIKLVKQK